MLAYILSACLPELMPSFPEHRNKKRPVAHQDRELSSSKRQKLDSFVRKYDEYIVSGVIM